MIRTFASTPKSLAAYDIVDHLQKYFVKYLNRLSNEPFEAVEWLRDEGLHGGGLRFEAKDEEIFNRASVNISQIHYDDLPEKQLSSATAISTIIHPRNPHAPSIHMHISWTQMKDGTGYWRIMADLNPSIPNEADKEAFTKALISLSEEHEKEARAQGDKYFFIPSLKRHRGVSHFYLENFNSGDDEADEVFARQSGKKVIDAYIALLSAVLKENPSISKEDKKQQLAYHTLYLFQVLTLDRGTTSGLLVHDQNDVGILGSLPSHVDRELLKTWGKKMPSPQEKLLENIIAVLPANGIMIDSTIKTALAQVVRKHYQTYPEALSLQASGNTVPPTVQNHL